MGKIYIFIKLTNPYLYALRLKGKDFLYLQIQKNVYNIYGKGGGTVEQ